MFSSINLHSTGETLKSGVRRIQGRSDTLVMGLTIDTATVSIFLVNEDHAEDLVTAINNAWNAFLRSEAPGSIDAFEEETNCG